MTMSGEGCQTCYGLDLATIIEENVKLKTRLRHLRQWLRDLPEDLMDEDWEDEEDGGGELDVCLEENPRTAKLEDEGHFKQRFTGKDVDDQSLLITKMHPDEDEPSPKDRIGLIGKPEVMDIKVEWTDPSVDEAQESTDLEMDGSFNSSFSPSKGPKKKMIKLEKPRQQNGKWLCDLCDHSASTLSNLRRHKRGKHEGIRYPCDVCSYMATRAGDLKLHKASKHEGLRFYCEACEYSSPYISALRKHKRIKHDGVTYPCDQCGHAATTLSGLRRHIEGKHEGKRYQCDQCSFSCTQSYDLKRHMDSKHKELQDDNITRYGSGTENMEGSNDPETKILPEQALENQ